MGSAPPPNLIVKRRLAAKATTHSNEQFLGSRATTSLVLRQDSSSARHGRNNRGDISFIPRLPIFFRRAGEGQLTSISNL